MTDFDFDFDGFLLDAASLIDRDKKHQFDFEENLKKYSEDCEENGMSMNELLDYCKNNNDDEENPQLEAQEVIEDEEIEEINNPVSNEIIPSKEHIINMFSKEFVENIEKTMSLRVEQLKNTNYKFKFLNIPSSLAEKSQEDFKQTFFNTPEMSGSSSHYSKSIERTANFGEAYSNIQPMQQSHQGMHKMTFMMTLESTSASFNPLNQFNTMMKNTFPALDCQNQQISILPYQQHPHPPNQLEKAQPLAIEAPPVVITISSSDEAPAPVKVKQNLDRNKTKNANKENKFANNKKSTIDPPKVTIPSIKKTRKRVRRKKLEQRERHRVSLPSESSDDESVPLQSLRLSDFVKRHSNSDAMKVVGLNDSLDAIPTKEFKIVVVDCMKDKQLHDIKDEIEDIEESDDALDEPLDALDEPLDALDESVDALDEPPDMIEEPNILNEDSCNPENNNEISGIPNEDLCILEDGGQTDDTISTITSDDEKFFFFEKYDKLRKEKRQKRLHERSIRRGLYSDYKPEISITHPVASSTLITPQSAPVVHYPLSTTIETSMTHPVACSTIKQPPSAKVGRPRKITKSPLKAKKKAPKRQLPNNKPNLSSKKMYIIYSSDSESNSSVSTITSDDAKFFEKDKYDKLREEKHALRAALRAERKKRN